MEAKRHASCVVVLSGGQDSTTCLFWARERYAKVHAVTFNYGQSHSIEIESARKVVALAGIAGHEVVDVGRLLRSTSPLLDESAPLAQYDDFESMDRIIGKRIESTFVPMRNAFFLTLAANIAVSLGCRTLVTGVDEEDNANYPDCRESFIRAQELTINEAMGVRDFRIETPLIHFSKADTVRLAQSLPGCMEAMAWSHTCYAGSFPPCGRCHACVLRRHGFDEAGVPDPLELRAAGKPFPTRGEHHEQRARCLLLRIRRHPSPGRKAGWPGRRRQLRNRPRQALQPSGSGLDRQAQSQLPGKRRRLRASRHGGRHARPHGLRHGAAGLPHLVVQGAAHHPDLP
nr:7-cyano-7-deazaguanine synthase QueC [Desulfovibrio sp.]